ncbi:MAG: type IV pilin N-terminal domain-containing protein [Haloferacaceae archaeon]
MHRLTPFRGETDAAAPVVGIVLLVAIAVTLATLVSFSVLGLGGVHGASPSATWSGEVVDTNPGDGDRFLVLSHGGGDAVTSARLDAVILSGEGNASIGTLDPEAAELTAGDTVGVTISGNDGERFPPGTEIALVWKGEERSAILYEVTIERAIVIDGGS